MYCITLTHQVKLVVMSAMNLSQFLFEPSSSLQEQLDAASQHPCCLHKMNVIIVYNYYNIILCRLQNKFNVSRHTVS